jgi:hypothetical protein
LNDLPKRKVRPAFSCHQTYLSKAASFQCLGVRVSTSSAGEIGRILLQELGDGRCHISCEVVGDPSDPMTTQRAAIFKPLGLQLTRQTEAVMGRTSEKVGSFDLPPRPPETKEMESKLIPCKRCGPVVAMLIFAPNATAPGHFEDYAKTLELTEKHHKPCLHIHPGVKEPGKKLADFVADNEIQTLNVAGPRASKEPDVAKFVRQILDEVFWKRIHGRLEFLGNETVPAER